MATCVYKLCKNSYYKSKKNGQDIQFFRVPNEARIKNEWRVRCGLDVHHEFKTHHRVCSQHFLQTDFGPAGGRRDLSSTALPRQSPGSVNVTNNLNYGTLKLRLPTNLTTADVYMCGELLVITFDASLNAGSNQANGNFIPTRTSGPPINQTKIAKDIRNRKRQREAKRQNANQHEKLCKSLRTRIKNLEVTKKKLVTFWRYQYISKCKDSSSILAKIKELKIQRRDNSALKPLSKIFTNGQMRLLMDPTKRQTKWTEEDISKALCLRSKSLAAYEVVRNLWKIPLPSLSTLHRWVTEISFHPGLLMPVFSMLKCMFSN